MLSVKTKYMHFAIKCCKTRIRVVRTANHVITKGIVKMLLETPTKNKKKTAQSMGKPKKPN